MSWKQGTGRGVPVRAGDSREMETRMSSRAGGGERCRRVRGSTGSGGRFGICSSFGCRLVDRSDAGRVRRCVSLSAATAQGYRRCDRVWDAVETPEWLSGCRVGGLSSGLAGRAGRQQERRQESRRGRDCSPRSSMRAEVDDCGLRCCRSRSLAAAKWCSS